ncbi:MAG: ParB/RepB/Spo0J family partition protein [Lachnospiraceae bacterium]|nr:ParB/RepB/Spo0J family partition protein [Lachnospiraceae bacterium]
MARKGGLGRGIEALIPTGMISVDPNNAEISEDGAENVIYVKISKVVPDPEQPRKNFREEELQDLSDSIKSHGIIQPILVEKKDNYYEIVTGERRWRAAKQAGLTEIPVIVREFTKKDKMEIQLIENLQREKLNPLEEAEGYKRLLSEFDMTQEELAVNIGKSRTVITNTMRLLHLDERARHKLIEGKISAGHARALLSLDSLDKQAELAEKIENDRLSVRDVERLVKRINEKPKEKPKDSGFERDLDSVSSQNGEEQKPLNQAYELVYKDLEDQLKGRLSCLVRILPKDGEKGRVEIDYNSVEELETIVRTIMG